MVSAIASNSTNPVSVDSHLHLENAIDQGQTDEALMLLQKEGVANTPLSNGEMPLNYAIRRGEIEIVKRAFKQVKFDIGMKDCHGLTPLDHAVLCENPEMKTLVFRGFFDICIESAKGQINKSGVEDFVKKSIAEAEKVRRLDINNSSGFQFAAFMGDLEKLKDYVYLLGSDVNQSDVNGLTPLHYGSLGGKEEVVKWLLNNGAKSDLLTNDRKSALHYAAISDSQKTAEILLSSTKLSPNSVDALGRSPLHYSVVLKNPSLAQILIKEGADPLDTSSGTAPLAALLHVLQLNTESRNPLKLDNASIFMFACFVGSWIMKLTGNKSEAKSLNWLALLSQIYMGAQNGSAWPALLRAPVAHYFFARGIPGVSYFGFIANFALTNISVSTAVNGIMTSRKCLTYETLRPIRNAIVHSVNGLASIHAFYNRGILEPQRQEEERRGKERK